MANVLEIARRVAPCSRVRNRPYRVRARKVGAYQLCRAERRHRRGGRAEMASRRELFRSLSTTHLVSSCASLLAARCTQRARPSRAQRAETDRARRARARTVPRCWCPIESGRMCVRGMLRRGLELCCMTAERALIILVMERTRFSYRRSVVRRAVRARGCLPACAP